MRSTSFTIIGNHKNKKGNPLPKSRLTFNQRWTEKAKNYVAWKEYVVASFLDSFKGNAPAQRLYALNMAQEGKPIILKNHEHSLMILHIEWGNAVHGDPENIFGSIADSIFYNDKNLDCIALSRSSPTKKGRVRGVIWVFDDETGKIDFIKKLINI